eukprot:gb/GECG01010147.1/.p1 GENE.gb/GECG01010147.1/~~gb/GECG01010147.1/.p1  ORF type:complete len:812 (+),score=88.35 gb/GECG01010147.1/:1-2436(+)
MRSCTTVGHLLWLACLATCFSVGRADDHNLIVSFQNQLEANRNQNCYCELDDEYFFSNCELSGCEGNAIQVNPQSPAALAARGIRSNAFSDSSLSGPTKMVLKDLSLETLESNAFKGLGQIEELDLSNNIIDEIQDNTVVQGLANLKKLSLQENRLRVIDSGIFRRTEKLAEVNLNDNDISRIAPSAFSKPEDTFEKIFLANNQLDSIDFRLFYSQANLKELDLSGNHLTSLPGDFLSASSYLDYIDLSHNRLTADGLVTPLSNVQASAIDLSYNKLSSLMSSSYGILRGLSKTKSLYLNHNEITDISNRDFTGTTMLIDVNLSNNEINSIQSYSFSELDHLEEIVLSGNRLTSFTHGQPVFNRLPRIVRIDVSHNRVNSVRPSAFELSNFDEYRGILDLSHNCLAHITADSFHIRGLRTLNLQNNDVTDVSTKNPFGNLYFLEVILDNNKISEIKKGMFSSPFLNRVSLKRNWIRSIEAGSFQTMCYSFNEDCEVDISGNRIDTLEAHTFEKIWPSVNLFMQESKIKEIESTAFENGPEEVDTLNLEDNNLIHLETKAFKGLRDVGEILLSRNSIRSIDEQTFSGIETVKTLNLSDNLIGALQGNHFSVLSSLEVLDVSRNSIETIKARSFNTPSLTNLDLSENRVLVVEAFSFDGLSGLRNLSMHQNTILSVDADAFFGLSSLERLNLGENRISEIRPAMFDSVSDILTHLDVSHNRVARVFPGSFEGMSNLTHLSLENNNIKTLSEATFSGVDTTSINLAANNIKHVNWVNDANFQMMDLSNNNIESLPEGLSEERHSKLILEGNPVV